MIDDLAQLDRPVSFHRLVYLEDGEDVTVGRPDTDSFAVLPQDGAQLVRRLEEGQTPRQVAAWYEVTYGRAVDIRQLLDDLEELEFVREGDGAPGPSAPAPAGPAVRWRRLGAVVFSWPALLGSLLVLGWAAAAMLRAPDLRPTYRSVFFVPSFAVVEIVLVVVQFPAVLLHEAAHALAGRRLGLETRLTLGRRFTFLVFETTIKGLVAVPRRRRILPILAGPMLDVLLIAALTLVASATRAPDGHLSAVGRFCLAVSYTTLLRLVWQLYFHLRTDGYFLFSTVFGCYDLHRTAGLVLRNRVRRLRGRRLPAIDEAGWHPVDRRVARWYSWLMVAGYAFSGATFAFALMPTAYFFLAGIAANLANQSGHSGAARLDSAVFLLMNLAQLAAICAIAVRDRRRRPRAPTPPTRGHAE